MLQHLLTTDAISWSVLANIRLTEDDTTSSSRIFIKILFQDLSENMGLLSLNMRLQEPTLQMYFEGIFPKVLVLSSSFVFKINCRTKQEFDNNIFADALDRYCCLIYVAYHISGKTVFKSLNSNSVQQAVYSRR